MTLDERYAEHKPPEPYEDMGIVLHTCYVCGELANPKMGECRDCGATWEIEQ